MCPGWNGTISQLMNILGAHRSSSSVIPHVLALWLYLPGACGSRGPSKFGDRIHGVKKGTHRIANSLDIV